MRLKKSQHIILKESERTVLENDLDWTVTEREMVTEPISLDIQSPNLSETKSEENVITEHIISLQEVIVLSPDS